MLLDQKKALSWLNDKWGKKKRQCEICEKSQWTLSKDVVTPIIYQESSGRTYPQFFVICKNCGNTKYFNAVVSGMVKGEE
jgi:hypothetical protein